MAQQQPTGQLLSHAGISAKRGQHRSQAKENTSGQGAIGGSDQSVTHGRGRGKGQTLTGLKPIVPYVSWTCKPKRPPNPGKLGSD
jgi:hypothetical protein